MVIAAVRAAPAGPSLYVMRPNGKYKVSARFKGLTESLAVLAVAGGGMLLARAVRNRHPIPIEQA